ncbi:hypothetical protein RhiirA5_506570 [Rhizophagus irregularis]|uniref:Uncharacterized protein n=1 Tax=Rhizophagus irregularis TaxID=588596 RepID=A0A2I1FEW7_9GLOM|nr:hypothetical protein RhiirA5_506570 [Rhizophagus irregularis]PKC54129.1 hypothetical protein RhiirA1_542984 [Rhizophagus irregularis]PKY32921.1 hypothetical protein RhiirB3_532263 [Rhizophagus irregularis]
MPLLPTECSRNILYFLDKREKQFYSQDKHMIINSLYNKIELSNRIQKFVDAIYHMIIRKSTTFQEFEVNATQKNFVDLPKDLITDDEKHQNTIRGNVLSGDENILIKVSNLELEFRKETLKELVIDSIDFQQFVLSFIEHLEFLYCEGFDHCKDLFKNKLYLKEFKLWYCNMEMLVELSM